VDDGAKGREDSMVDWSIGGDGYRWVERVEEGTGVKEGGRWWEDMVLELKANFDDIEGSDDEAVGREVSLDCIRCFFI